MNHGLLHALGAAIVLMLATAGCGKDDAGSGGTGGDGCAPDESVCGNACIDLYEDRDHCGSCGNACGSDQVCQSGVCLNRCPDGATMCGDGGGGGGGPDQCVSTPSDADNCGSCGNDCEGQVCAAGECVATCPDGTIQCGDDCPDIAIDPAHCGECEHECGTGQSCQDGACHCPDGLTVCGNDCADLEVDDDHCGECGNDCENGSVCIDGHCDCGPGADMCDGECTDLQHDENNCGECGHECAESTEVCEAGACTCRPGFAACGDACVHLGTNPAHCGECGHACDGPCGDGQCVESCEGFPDQCGQSCTNTNDDPLNCDECGDACDGDEVCLGGDCRRADTTECNACPCDACHEGDACCVSEFLDAAVCVQEGGCGG